MLYPVYHRVGVSDFSVLTIIVFTHPISCDVGAVLLALAGLVMWDYIL
jgi:hypothetical protein